LTDVQIMQNVYYITDYTNLEWIFQEGRRQIQQFLHINQLSVAVVNKKHLQWTKAGQTSGFKHSSRNK